MSAPSESPDEHSEQPERTFTQTEVDQVVTERLRRERKRCACADLLAGGDTA